VDASLVEEGAHGVHPCAPGKAFDARRDFEIPYRPHRASIRRRRRKARRVHQDEDAEREQRYEGADEQTRVQV
jgi:hypothetical protein